MKNDAAMDLNWIVVHIDRNNVVNYSSTGSRAILAKALDDWLHDTCGPSAEEDDDGKWVWIGISGYRTQAFGFLDPGHAALFKLAWG